MKIYFQTLFLILLAFGFLGLSESSLAAPKVLKSEHDAAVDELQALYDVEQNMKYQTGNVQIAGVGTLDVPAGFRFLDQEQSTYVLKEVWENLSAKTNGMLFTKDASLLGDDGYSINLKFTPAGYVPDQMAEEINFEGILSQMKDKNARANKLREEKGMFPVQLVSWADDPYYDGKSRRLHWSKHLEYEMGSEKVAGLNYAIRFLGRTGFLEMNFVGRMDQLDLIKSDLALVLNSWKFNEGFRYEDFNADTDKIAAVDVQGLMVGESKTPAPAIEEPSQEKPSSNESPWFKKYAPFLFFALITFLLAFVVSARKRGK